LPPGLRREPHHARGVEYGYPACCIEAFCRDIDAGRLPAGSEVSSTGMCRARRASTLCHASPSAVERWVAPCGAAGAAPNLCCSRSA
jgi:hypothetical protein